MYNIMKSVNYTIRRDITVLVTFFALLTAPLFAMFIASDGKAETMTGSMYFASMGDIYVLFLIAVLIIAAKACGADAGDRTLNYELMAGHKRASVYWSRIFVGCIWSVLIVMAFHILPVGYLTLAKGFGGSVKVSDMLLRILLLTLTTFRLASFVMLLATVFRSVGMSIVIGYVLIEASAFLSIFTEDGSMDWLIYATGLGNAMYLLGMPDAGTGKTGEIIFDASLSGNVVLATSVVSVFFGLFYLVMGYIYFKRKDRD